MSGPLRPSASPSHPPPAPSDTHTSAEAKPSTWADDAIAEEGVQVLLDDRTRSPDAGEDSQAVSGATFASQETKVGDDEKEKDMEAQADGGEGGERKQGQGELTDQTNLLPRRQLITVMIALAAATALAFLDQTIVATALPTISAQFGAGKDSTWVASSFLLASTAFQPIYGRLSDIWGRKIVLLVGLLIFLVASLACALSQTMVQLIVFRAWQGVGGGSVLTLVLVIMGDVVTLRDRAKYSGIIEAVIALSNGVGPTVGGALTSEVSWTWCFWINLPICAAVMAIIAWCLPQKKIEGGAKEKLKRIDYVGSALSLAASILILMPLQWGGITFPWNSAPVISLLVVGGVVAVVFIVWEARWPKLPIIPMGIFRYPTVVGVLIATAFNGWMYYVSLYFIPQMFQVSRGFSPLKSGYLVLPLVVTPACSVFASGLAVSRGLIDIRIPILLGFAMAAVGNGLLSTITTTTSIGELAGYMVITGIGMGLTFQNTLVAAQAASPRNVMAVVTSVRNFVRSVGSVIGLAAATATVNNTLKSELRSRLSDSAINSILDDPTIVWRSNTLGLEPDATQLVAQAYIDGFRGLELTLAAVAAFSCLACLVLVRKVKLDRADDKALKAEAKQRIQDKKAARKGKAAMAGDPATPERRGSEVVTTDSGKDTTSDEKDAGDGKV